MYKQLFYLFSIFFITILIDQSSKALAQVITQVEINQGVSFSWLSGWSVLVHVVLYLLIVTTLLFGIRPHTRVQKFWFAVLAGAGFSNLLDRFFWGGVQDFLPVPFVHLKNNLADWLILFSVVVILWNILKESQKEKKSDSY